MLSYLSVITLVGAAGWLFMGAFDGSDEDTDARAEDFDAADQDGGPHPNHILSMDVVQNDMLQMYGSRAPMDDEVLALELQGDIDAENGTGDPVAEASQGFRMSLPPDGQLALNVEDGIEGQILQVHAKHDATGGGEDGRTDLRFSVNFYLAGSDVPPEGTDFTGSEPELIAGYGLEKLGEIAMGRFSTTPSEDGSGYDVTEYSRQTDPPEVIANRDVTTLKATFA